MVQLEILVPNVIPNSGYEVVSKCSVSQHDLSDSARQFGRDRMSLLTSHFEDMEVTSCLIDWHCQRVLQLKMACKKATMSMQVPQKLVQRVCVWFSMRIHHPAVETVRLIQDVFGANSYSERSIYRWHKDFQSGRTKLGDLFRKGGPKLAQNATMVASCRRKVERNRRVSIHQLSASLGLSYGSVHSILHKDLKMSKKKGKLVPHVLNAVQRQQRMTFARDFLRTYRDHPEEQKWIITCDESYFHVYEPYSKMENRQWLTKDMNRPQQASIERSTAKVIFLPFFDKTGLLHAEFVQNTTVTSLVFRDILSRMRTSLRVRRGAAAWRMRHRYCLHMDNASTHRSIPVRQALEDMHLQKMRHPPYSPDLSPCDFFLFPLMKKKMQGIEYRTIENMKQAVLDTLATVTQQQWTYCFDQWIARCEKCLLFEGRYFEGMKFGLDG